jgi:hypothetical protein
MLAQYQYELLYRPGPSIANADGLSELRLPDMPKDLLKQLQTAPIDHRHLKKWTVRDPLLSNVSHLVQEQWLVHCPTEELQTYFKRRNKLLVEDRNPALGPLCCFRAFPWVDVLVQSTLQTPQQQLSISGKYSVLDRPSGSGTSQGITNEHQEWWSPLQLLSYTEWMLLRRW